MMDFIAWHQLHHPQMQAQDYVKLIFQSMCGCGHLLADEQTVTARIEMEESSLQPDAAEPLTEPLGTYIRLNLRRAMAEGIPAEWIARMMCLSAKQTLVVSDRQSVCSTALRLPEHVFQFSQAELENSVQRLLHEPDWIPGHTASYRALYAPAYRVVSQRFEYLLPVLCALGKLLQKERVLMCIDGPCGSGKSSLCRQLTAITGAATLSMDDFFTPHALKTPQRLAQPAGNAHIERFCAEFLHPWLKEGTAAYRPYLCHMDAFGEPVTVPSRSVTIIEGSYSLHPDIRPHADLCVFLTINPEHQCQRIAARNGEAMLQRFLSTWIPLEQAYFDAFALPDSGCLILPAQTEV